MHCFVDTVLLIEVDFGVELVVLAVQVVCFEFVLLVLESGRFWGPRYWEVLSLSAFDDEGRRTITCGRDCRCDG